MQTLLTQPALRPAPASPSPCQVVEAARAAREELATFRAAQEEPQGEWEGTPAAKRGRRQRAAKQAERLELAAADNLSQLRLACIHPQARRARAGLGSAAVA